MGRGMAGAEAGGPASACTWVAAGAARAWVAAAHNLAARESYRRASEAMAEAAAAARNAAAVGGDAVGRDGGVNTTAFANAAGLLEAAARA